MQLFEYFQNIAEKVITKQEQAFQQLTSEIQTSSISRISKRIQTLLKKGPKLIFHKNKEAFKELRQSFQSFDCYYEKHKLSSFMENIAMRAGSKYYQGVEELINIFQNIQIVQLDSGSLQELPKGSFSQQYKATWPQKESQLNLETKQSLLADQLITKQANKNRSQKVISGEKKLARNPTKQVLKPYKNQQNSLQIQVMQNSPSQLGKFQKEKRQIQQQKQIQQHNKDPSQHHKTLQFVEQKSNMLAVKKEECKDEQKAPVKQKSAEEILQELQEIHRRNRQKLHSQNKTLPNKKLRSKIIAKGAERFRKQSCHKKNMEEQFRANIEFLQSIKRDKKKLQPHFKQFNHLDSLEVKQMTSSLRLQNRKKLENLGFTDPKKDKYSRVSNMALVQNSQWLKSPSQKGFLPNISTKRNQSNRPKPYSIYHVYQKNEQYYQNSPVREN